MRVKKSALFGVLATVFILVCGNAYVNHLYQTAVILYSEQLAAVHSVEQVLYGDADVLISRGVILSNGTALSIHQRYDVLRLAYALTNARRNPIFSLEGTDLSSLIRSVQALEKESVAWANISSSSEHSATAGTLYPLPALHALVGHEKARREFLEAKNLESLERYQSAQKKVLQEYQRATRTVQMLAEKEVRENFVARSFAGAISRKTFLNALEEVDNRFSFSALLLSRIQRCVAGNVSVCDPSLVALPNVKKENVFRKPTLQEVVQARRVQALYAHTFREKMPMVRSDRMVALDASACAPRQVPAALFSDTSGTDSSLVYLSDLLLYPIRDTGDFTGQVRDLGDEMVMNHFPYLFRNPTSYYVCPLLANDISLIDTTLSVYAFAKRYPAIASKARMGLVANERVVSAHDARAFLDEAITELSDDSLSTNVRHEIERLSAQMRDGSAGFERVPHTIASWMQHGIESKKSGKNISLAMGDLLPLHVGIFGLYLAGNGSVRSDAVTPFVAAETPGLEEKIVRWSNMRDVSDREMARMLQVHVDFHNPRMVSDI